MECAPERKRPRLSAESNSSCKTDACPVPPATESVSPVLLQCLSTNEAALTPTHRKHPRRIKGDADLDSPPRQFPPRTRRDEALSLADDLSTLTYRRFMLEDLKQRETIHQPGRGRGVPALPKQARQPRRGLVDWLINVHRSHRCVDNTLYISLNYFERCLQNKHFRALKVLDLDLLVVTCYFIASKWEETKTFEIQEYARLVSKTTTKKELLECEKEVLAALDFNLNVILPLHFLNDFLDAADAGDEAEYYAHFLLELGLIEEDLIGTAPSLMAAAAVTIAVATFEGREVSVSDHRKHQLASTRRLLVAGFNRMEKDDFIFKKYADDTRHGVAHVSPVA